MRHRLGLQLYWRQIADWAAVGLLVLIVAIPAGLLGWLIFFTDTFAVRAVTVLDAREHTAQETEQLLAGTRSKNMLFIQVDLLEQEILQHLPQVRTVHIERKLPGALKVVIQEKEPRLLLLSQANYYFIDETGAAYEEASLDRLPGVVLPTVKNTDGQAELTLGTRVVSEEFVQFIETIDTDLPESVATPVEYRIPSLAAREVHVLLDNNWTIRFDVTRTVKAQLSVLDRLLSGTISEEEKAALDYIDLRIPDRVFYKARTPATPGE